VAVPAPARDRHLRRGLRPVAGLPDRRAGSGPRCAGRRGRGRRSRRGGLDHRDCDVHLPAGRGAADDRPAGRAGRLVGRLRGRLGGDRLRAGGLRAALARIPVSAAGRIATVSGAVLALACRVGPHRRRAGAA
jgi:hypothetical protein